MKNFYTYKFRMRDENENLKKTIVAINRKEKQGNTRVIFK